MLAFMKKSSFINYDFYVDVIKIFYFVPPKAHFKIHLQH